MKIKKLILVTIFLFISFLTVFSSRIENKKELKGQWMKKVKESYKNGKKHGLCVYYHYDFNIKNFKGLNFRQTEFIKEVAMYKDGKRHGWTCFYCFDDIVRDYVKKVFVNGKKYSPLLIEKTQYRNGKKHGWSYIKFSGYPYDEWQFYYVNGKKHGWSYFKSGVSNWRTKGSFRNGKKHGFGFAIGEKDGKKLFAYAVFKNGKRVAFKDTYEGAVTGPFGEGNARFGVSLFDQVWPSAYKDQTWPKPFFGYHGNDYYSKDFLVDGIKQTAWVSCWKDLKKYIFWIVKIHNKPMKYLIITNGNQINKKEYYKFSRIKKAVLIIYTYIGKKKRILSKKIILFNDNLETKKIFIKKYKYKVLGIQMKVKSIYPGTKYSNLSVSDFYVTF